MEKTSVPRCRRRTPQQWAKLVTESESTQLSLAQFCAANGVSQGMLKRWRWRFENEKAGQKSQQPAFVPVRVLACDKDAVARQPVGYVDVSLNNGRVVRVTGAVDCDWLRSILAAADGGAPC